MSTLLTCRIISTIKEKLVAIYVRPKRVVKNIVKHKSVLLELNYIIVMPHNYKPSSQTSFNNNLNLH